MRKSSRERRSTMNDDSYVYDGDVSDVSQATAKQKTAKKAPLEELLATLKRLEPEEEKGPARPRIPCPKCDQTFDKKERLRLHVNSEHREERGRSEEVKYLPLQEIPENVTELKVKRVFPWYKDPPVGYNPADRPMVMVSYYCGRVPNAFVSYDEVRRRFPRELNNYFIGGTTLVSKE